MTYKQPIYIQNLYKFEDLNYFSVYDGRLKTIDKMDFDLIRFHHIFSYQEFKLNDFVADSLLLKFDLNLNY